MINFLQISAKLSDYRTQFRSQGDSKARELFNTYVNGDANGIRDLEKRVEFGHYYCKGGEFKFQFKGSERPIVRHTLFLFSPFNFITILRANSRLPADF